MPQEKLVLMSCCAPCSVAAIKQLIKWGGDFIVLFYNPNIFPRGEYDRRLAEQIKFCEKMGVKYAVGDYNHDDWLSCIKGFEESPEMYEDLGSEHPLRGERCFRCFEMRFKWGAKWAAKNGYNFITSVFGVSYYKSQIQVDEAANGLPIQYVDCNFGYAPEPGMYRQKYCGCPFSAKRIGTKVGT